MPSKRVREAVRVKQLHQLPPELAHLGGFRGGEFLLLRQRRRCLRIFSITLRARLPVFLRDLPGHFLARSSVLESSLDRSIRSHSIRSRYAFTTPHRRADLRRMHFGGLGCTNRLFGRAKPS